MPNRQEQFNDDNPALVEAWRQLRINLPRFKNASLKKDHPDRLDHVWVDCFPKLPLEAIVRKHFTLEQYAWPLRYGSYLLSLTPFAAVIYVGATLL